MGVADLRTEDWNLVVKFGIEGEAKSRAPTGGVYLPQSKIPESDSIIANMTVHVTAVVLGRKIFSERKKCFHHMSGSFPFPYFF